MEPNSTTALARLAAVQNHLTIQPCFHRHAIHNDKPTGPADLARERANASFKVDDMTEVLFRGKENVDAMVTHSILPCCHIVASVLYCHTYFD
jgi:acyl-CoA oxidase